MHNLSSTSKTNTLTTVTFIFHSTKPVIMLITWTTFPLYKFYQYYNKTFSQNNLSKNSSTTLLDCLESLILCVSEKSFFNYEINLLYSCGSLFKAVNHNLDLKSYKFVSVLAMIWLVDKTMIFINYNSIQNIELNWSFSIFFE